MNNREKKEQRRLEADERNARWDALTPAEKLAELDARLGADLGAVKQRRKLEPS